VICCPGKKYRDQLRTLLAHSGLLALSIPAQSGLFGVPLAVFGDGVISATIRVVVSPQLAPWSSCEHSKTMTGAVGYLPDETGLKNKLTATEVELDCFVAVFVE